MELLILAALAFEILDKGEREDLIKSTKSLAFLYIKLKIRTWQDHRAGPFR